MTEEEYRIADAEGLGYCRACGAERGAYEPDACNYRCEECEESEVFGAEELMIMGLIDIVEEA